MKDDVVFGGALDIFPPVDVGGARGGLQRPESIETWNDAPKKVDSSGGVINHVRVKYIVHLVFRSIFAASCRCRTRLRCAELVRASKRL